MSHGATYNFTIASSLDAPTIESELANVGAVVIPAADGSGPELYHVVGNTWTGAFTWMGLDGEPTEHLPNIDWVTLGALAPLA